MGPLINPERPRKVREYRNARAFNAAVADRSAGTDAAAKVEVVIQVRDKRLRSWTDLVEYWSGPWSPEIPTPTQRDLIAAGRSVGARYVRHVVRTVI